jgi:hypothetical protein
MFIMPPQPFTLSFNSLPHLEKRQLLLSYLSLSTGLGIPSGISAIFPHGEAPKSPDFNSPALLERFGETIKE